MFSTQGQEVKESTGKKMLDMGHVYAHVYSAKVVTSKAGDRKQLQLVLEGPAVEGEFEGMPINWEDKEGPKHKGMVAYVAGSGYIDTFNDGDITKNEILNKMATIAKHLGVKDMLDKIKVDTIEEWVDAAFEVIKGNDLWFFLAAEKSEYNDKTRTKLSLPKFNFCHSDKSKLPEFDMTNKYHFQDKTVGKATVSDFEPAGTEGQYNESLPFSLED